MSDYEAYKGKLYPVPLLDSGGMEGTAKLILEQGGVQEPSSYSETYLEELMDWGYGEYYVTKDRIYRISKEEVYTSERFSGREHIDGVVDFDVIYYNGGCSFNDALEEVFKNKEVVV